MVICLFDFIHQVDSEGRGLLLSELKLLVNQKLFENEETGCQSENKLGNVLTSLGLTDRFRTNCGWLETRKQIPHALHRMHDLETSTMSPNPRQCRLCSALNTGYSVPTRSSGDPGGSLQ